MTIEMSDEQLIEFYNKHTFQELIPIIKSGLEMGTLETDGPLVEIWTAGWSDDENMIYLLTDPRCRHRRNYIGNVYAVSYFVKDKDTKYDYDYKIVAEKKERKQ